MKQIRGSSMVRTVSLSFIDFQTKLQVFFMVGAYVLLGNDITAEKVNDRIRIVASVLIV